MLELKFTAKFKKDYKRVKRQGKGLSKLELTLGRLYVETLFPMPCTTIRSAGHIAAITSVTSTLTGCSSIVWTKTSLYSLLRERKS